MSYESLSDGGFATGSMLDQVDLLFTMIHLALFEYLAHENAQRHPINFLSIR
jgi:hypothetical protein